MGHIAANILSPPLDLVSTVLKLTEHVLKANDARQVVVEVDVELFVRKPQPQKLQEFVVQLHAWEGYTTEVAECSGQILVLQ